MTSINESAVDNYGKGCIDGHEQAKAWLDNPKRGNPSYGGTLQQWVLWFAKRMADAMSDEERHHIRGEIVGFCYAIECPADAERCIQTNRRLEAAARLGRSAEKIQ